METISGNTVIRVIHFHLLFLALGWSQRHALNKVTWWHFQSTSKEVSLSQIFFNYMHGLKNAIGNFSERAGMAELC